MKPSLKWKLLLAGTVLISGLSSGCSQSRSPQMGNTVAELQGQLDALRNRVGELEQRSDGLTPQTRLEKLQSQLDQLQRTQFEQRQSVNAMEADLSTRLEEAQAKLNQQDLMLRQKDTSLARLERSIRELRLTMDELYQNQNPIPLNDRLGRQNGTQGSRINSGGQAGSMEDSTALSSAEPKSPPRQPETVMPIPRSPELKAQEAPQLDMPSPAPMTEGGQSLADTMFDQAWSFYQDQDYGQAIKIFTRLRNQFPNHPVAVDAHFWMAKSYTHLQEFSPAALEYYDFIKANPQHPNALEAMWELGQALENSGDIGLARGVYEELANTNSPFAQQALDRLELYDNLR